MTRILIPVSAAIFIAISTCMTPCAGAQEAVPTDPLPPQVPVVEPASPADLPPSVPPWTYERETPNRQGTVTNTHRYLENPQDGRYVREHVVVNPRGEMTQSWERLNTEEGYQYRRSQSWTGNDGTQLRQHERAIAGSDPYNYTREHSITLPDGRMVNQTQVRSWDGTNGTMERSFIGPNGQTRQTQRSWTPDELTGAQTVGKAEPVQPTAISPLMTQPTSPPAEKVSWWQKLNPFRKRNIGSVQSAAVSSPKRGFTIGTPNSNASRASSFSSGGQRSVRGSQQTHQPSWAGGPTRSMRVTGPSPQANGHSTAMRPNKKKKKNR